MSDLETELGRTPEEAELAARLNVTVGRYREQLAAASVMTVSLDEPDPRDDDDDSPSFADAARDHNAPDPGEEAVRRDDLVGLARQISRLGDRQKLVLALYYQDELTFREIGEILGVTESRVCQIHTESILLLRNRMLDPDVLARFPRRRVRR
jgi:RNA polymerase sigma factor for flagellar operon FliA